MAEIYTTGKYKESNPGWHAEDSKWKATYVDAMLSNNKIHYKSVCEVGCGAGLILDNLSEMIHVDGVSFEGYDISPQAIELTAQVKNKNIKFYNKDLFSGKNKEFFDVLLVMDVFEHVPDYMGFLEKCRGKAKYKVYHIPLDLHVSSVLRNVFLENRKTIGHLHYFTADSAIETLKDTGHEIIDFCYTNAAVDLFNLHPSFKKALANVPRVVLSKFSLPFSSRLLGGYSLMVLTK